MFANSSTTLAYLPDNILEKLTAFVVLFTSSQYAFQNILKQGVTGVINVYMKENDISNIYFKVVNLILLEFFYSSDIVSCNSVFNQCLIFEKMVKVLLAHSNDK